MPKVPKLHLIVDDMYYRKHEMHSDSSESMYDHMYQ